MSGKGGAASFHRQARDRKGQLGLYRDNRIWITHLLDPVTQGLRKSAVVIVDGIHVAGDAGIVSRAADDADCRSPLVKLAPGYLDTAVSKAQRPLALKAVLHSRAYAGAAVSADLLFVLVQQWLIEHQDIARRVTGLAAIDELCLVDPGVGNGYQCRRAVLRARGRGQDTSG